MIPIFGSTGTRCLIDGDNDGADDKDGFCVELPGDDQGASACLPDCAALDGGDVTSCVAVDSEGEGTAYCQPLEARGMGLLVDLSDNAAADGSAGHPTPDDRAVCIGPDSACSEDSECDTATSIGCSAGVCMPPSLNACASGGVPGQATAGTACDANETGSNNGFCVPTSDTDGDGSADAVTQCLVACTSDGGAGTCTTASAICLDFTDADPTDGIPGAGLFVCVPAP